MTTRRPRDYSLTPKTHQRKLAVPGWHLSFDPEDPSVKSGENCLTIVGNEPTKRWVTEQLDEKAYYEFCNKLGLDVEVPETVREELDDLAKFAGKRLIRNLMGQHDEPASIFEQIKGTGRTPQEAIAMAVSDLLGQLDEIMGSSDANP